MKDKEAAKNLFGIMCLRFNKDWRNNHTLRKESLLKDILHLVWLLDVTEDADQIEFADGLLGLAVSDLESGKYINEPLDSGFIRDMIAQLTRLSASDEPEVSKLSSHLIAILTGVSHANTGST